MKTHKIITPLLIILFVSSCGNSVSTSETSSSISNISSKEVFDCNVKYIVDSEIVHEEVVQSNSHLVCPIGKKYLGYTINSWYTMVNEEKVQWIFEGENPSLVQEDTILYADFLYNSYKISFIDPTFNKQIDDVEVQYKQSYFVPSLYEKNYKFLGWSDEYENFLCNFENYLYEKDITVEAKWRALTNKEKGNLLGLTDTFTVKDTLEEVNNKPCRVVILLGQSNATGVSLNSALQNNDKVKFNEYKDGYENVKINYITENGKNSSNNTFIKTQLGQGAGSAYFGPEMGIAEKYHYAYPDDDTFIIKYTYGGSALNSMWLDGNAYKGEMYYASINFIYSSLEYLISKGYKLTIDAICWMQGESDSGAYGATWYYNNLSNFVFNIRYDLAKYTANLKFIDAYINNIDKWPYHEKVNESKQKFADMSELNYCIDTISLKLTSDKEPSGNPDIAHYDSMSMVMLGQAFGIAAIYE